MKQQMTSEFQCIYGLCEYVIKEAIANPQNIK